jgi:tight adherence protein C
VVVDAPNRRGVDVTVTSTLGPAGMGLGVALAGLVARPRLVRPARVQQLAAGPTVEHRWPRSSRSRKVARIVASIAATFSVAAAAGALAFGFAVAAMVLAQRLRPIHTARRHRAAIERTLPEALELLVLSVRAGLTPFQAVCDLATFGEPAVSDAFSEVVRRTQRGQPFAEALAALPERLGSRASGLADVIATSDRHGLPLGPVLDQLADEARSSRRRLDQAEARRLPVRLSFPLVACTLPSFVLLAIAPAVIAALSSLGGTAW